MSTSRDGNGEGRATHDWMQDLERRLTLVTPQDTTRGLFFNSILDAVQAHGDAALAARCREVLEGQQFLPFFNYPVGLMLRLVSIVARGLGGARGGPEEVLRMLGRKATADFEGSVMGNMLRLLNQGDIKQFMSNLHTIYRTTSSYGGRSVTWLGPRSGRIHITRSFMPPPYHEGILLETLQRLGAKEVWAHGYPVDGLDSACDFSWE